MFVDSAKTLRVLLVAAISALLALAVTSAFAVRNQGDDDRVVNRRAYPIYQRAPLLPFGGSSTADPGLVVWGGGTIAHSEDGGRAKPVRGMAGRMIFVGTDAWEPSLGVDKQGNILYHGKSGRFVNVMVSRDRGRSWNEVTPQAHTHTFDPLLHVDQQTGRAFVTDLTELACVTVSHTDDVGKSWISSKACGLTDRQNLFTGLPVSSPTVGYPNIVYVCAMDLGASSFAAFATSCLKSLDGGITWVRTGAPAYTADPRHEQGDQGIRGHCGGSSGHGFVDSKGVVYLPRGWCGQPYLAISRDEGATWERIRVSKKGMAQAMAETCVGVCKEDLGFSNEAAVAVDADGNIYYFWVARDRLPYLTVSRDEGRSFSEPVMVGPPGLKQAWGPKMDIGETGKIALAYVGSTNAPAVKPSGSGGSEYGDSVTWNGYLTTSVDALSEKPRFFSTSVNRPSDPIERGECMWRCGAQGDFIDVVVGPDGRPYTSMVDGCWPAPGDVCDAAPGFVGTIVGGPKLR